MNFWQNICNLFRKLFQFNMFGHNCKEELDIIKTLANNEKSLIHIIENLTKPKPDRKPIFGLSIKIQNKLYIMADISLSVGVQSNPGIFTLFDNKTQQPIAAEFSNQAVGLNTNAAAATFALDPANPNNAVPTAIAIGSGAITFTTHAKYTDPGDNSTQEGDFTVTKNFNVTSKDGVTFDVVFS